MGRKKRERSEQEEERKKWTGRREKEVSRKKRERSEQEEEIKKWARTSRRKIYLRRRRETGRMKNCGKSRIKSLECIWEEKLVLASWEIIWQIFFGSLRR